MKAKRSCSRLECFSSSARPSESLVCWFCISSSDFWWSSRNSLPCHLLSDDEGKTSCDWFKIRPRTVWIVRNRIACLGHLWFHLVFHWYWIGFWVFLSLSLTLFWSFWKHTENWKSSPRLSDVLGRRVWTDRFLSSPKVVKLVWMVPEAYFTMLARRFDNVSNFGFSVWYRWRCLARTKFLVLVGECLGRRCVPDEAFPTFPVEGLGESPL